MAIPALASCAAVFAAAAALAAQAPTDVLRGTVTDDTGAPAAGMTVEVRRRLGEGFSCLDLAVAYSLQPVKTLRTGKNGSFAAQLTRGVPFDVFVDDGVHAPIRRSAVYAGEDLALQLVAPARATLALRDAAGAPSPGGSLLAWDAQRVHWIAGSIDAQGRWQSERLPPGPMTFDISPASARRPEWTKVELTAGATTPLEFALEPGCILRGRVTDVTTSKPIAGARIGEGWTMDKFVVSDADGRYEMRGYGSPGYGEVRVTADGYGPSQWRVDPRAEPIERDFALAPGCEVSGRIVDPSGKPVVGAYVAAVGGDFTGGDVTHDWSSARTDAEGRYRLRGLRATVPHTLLVRADGWATLVGDMAAVGPMPLQLPDVTMRTPRYVSGVVVDGDGKPVVGLDVSLSGANADRAQLLGTAKGPGCSAEGDYCIAARTMRTDSLGRIHFADLPAGSYGLDLGREGRQSAQIDVVADRDPEPLRLQR
jgi:protocatechuate 3,4-dioxygenase beta subunit